jgi:uncharacterized protein YqgC (DUF456 family)
MEFTSQAILLIAIFAMIIATLLAIIPYIPGPILVWGIGLVTAFVTGFAHITVAAVLVMTVLMLLGTLQTLWMPLFGIQSAGLTCLGAVGSIIGGIAGTFLLPIPVVGTIIGSIAGALLVELVRFPHPSRAIQAGRTAFTLYVWGKAAELAFCLGIIAVFAFSAWSAGAV